MWCKGGNTVQQIISLITSGWTVFAKAKNQFSLLPPTITYFIAGNLKRAQRTITASSLHYYIEFISDISLLSPSFSPVDLKWPPPRILGAKNPPPIDDPSWFSCSGGGGTCINHDTFRARRSNGNMWSERMNSKGHWQFSMGPQSTELMVQLYMCHKIDIDIFP